MSTHDFFELVVLYFKFDTCNYFKNTGGLYGLDNLVDFDEVYFQINLSSYVQYKVDLVLIDLVLIDSLVLSQYERKVARRIRLNYFNYKFKRRL